jgi:hypothetical protein
MKMRPARWYHCLALILAPCLPLLVAVFAAAQSDAGNREADAAGKAIEPAPRDPAIDKALGQISADEIRSRIEKLVSFHNRSTLSSMEKELPEGQGANAAADWIEAEYQRYSAACGGCLEVKRDTFIEPAQPGSKSRIPTATKITNVYAVLKGSDPARKTMVLVTGHYDSRNSDTLDARGEAPGANDDASGVAVSLECARVLSQRKWPATIVFAAVAGEEQGLNGSHHLAQLAQSEGWKLEAVLNNDIVGGNTTLGDKSQDKGAVRVFSEGVPATASLDDLRRIEAQGTENDSPSRELARAVADVGKTYFDGHVTKSGTCPENCLHHLSFTPVLIFRLDRFLRGGDHSSFNQLGFAAVRFTEWREDFNHQHQNVRTEGGVEYGDLLKFVDFDYVAKVAKLNAATLATLASAPGAPRNTAIVTTGLDNNTTLKWEAPEGSNDDTKYEVVWRETSGPDWQFRTAAGGAMDGSRHTVTLPVSKDNVVFGVRSVDAAGHRSVATLPRPER